MVVAGENTAISLVNSTQREIAANLLNLFFGVGAFVAPFLVMPVLKTLGLFGGAESFQPADPCILALHLALSFPKPLLAQGFPSGAGWGVVNPTQVMAPDVFSLSLRGH